jgi:hypothetical protein
MESPYSKYISKPAKPKWNRSHSEKKRLEIEHNDPSSECGALMLFNAG